MGAVWVVVGVLAAIFVALLLVSALAAFAAERAYPPKGRFVATPDGARLHVLEAGEGPPVVLIHGLGGNAGNFTYSLIERLAANFRTYVIERPGSGYSTRPRKGRPGIRAQAATLAQAIRALGLSKPLVVGHSLGGAIALALALDHPDVVGGLALIAPLTRTPDGGAPPDVFKGLFVRSPLARLLIAWTLAVPSSVLNGRKVAAAVFAPEAAPADYALRGGGVLALRPRAFHAASTDMMAAPADMATLPEAYAWLRVPVGVLFGAEDEVLDAEHHGRSMAELAPGSVVEIVEGGHMLPVTRPEVCAAFIQRVASRMATAREARA